MHAAELHLIVQMNYMFMLVNAGRNSHFSDYFKTIYLLKLISHKQMANKLTIDTDLLVLIFQSSTFTELKVKLKEKKILCEVDLS